MQPIPRIRPSVAHALCGPLALCAAASVASPQVVLENLETSAVDDAEITPDGRLVVLRENTGFGNMAVRILDAHSGSVLLKEDFTAVQFNFNGAAHDAVAVTNERAVVLGAGLAVYDLTPATPVLLAHHTAGFFPRDVAITPNGQWAVVRAGEGFDGGLQVVDLATGAIAAHALGAPAAIPGVTFDVDSAVATDRHGVLLSLTPSASGDEMRVTVFDLQPASGGAPVVVLETGRGSAADQLGPPHDLTLTATGEYAAARSELSVALYRLDGAASSQVWHKRLFGDPGPFGGSALDSIEATADRIATLSRRSNPPIGAQLDVFDLAGQQWHAALEGDPHDLEFTPDGQRLVVRTSAGVYLFDPNQLPPGNVIVPLDFAAVSSSFTSFGAGLDSVAASDTRAVTLHRKNVSTEVRLWDLSAGSLGPAGTFTLPNKPCDVELSPNGQFAAVTGTDHVQIYDLVAGRLVLDHEPDVVAIGQYPWCDGVVLDDERAVAFGYVDNPLFDGWISLVDLDSAAYRYCPSTLNSSGARGDLEPTGSTSIALNAAGFLASDLPKSTVGALVFGSQSAWLPFGDGTLCVSGERYTPGAFHTAGTGSALQKLDFTGAPSQGGVITAGSTWYFQVWYRDTQSAGAQVNTTNAVKLSFQP
jgi:hypothetical protein